jgi:hypothetical protein
MSVSETDDDWGILSAFQDVMHKGNFTTFLSKHKVLQFASIILWLFIMFGTAKHETNLYNYPWSEIAVLIFQLGKLVSTMRT